MGEKRGVCTLSPPPFFFRTGGWDQGAKKKKVVAAIMKSDGSWYITYIYIYI